MIGIQCTNIFLSNRGVTMLPVPVDLATNASRICFTELTINSNTVYYLQFLLGIAG